MKRTTAEIEQQVASDTNFLVSAVTSELNQIAYLEYFDTWEANGGMQWFFDECVSLTNEVMFTKNSPYQQWLEHWKVTPNSEALSFSEVTGETCVDWYHMNEALKLFTSRYEKDECVKDQMAERIGAMLNYFEDDTNRNDLIERSLFYANKIRGEKKLSEVIEALKEMKADKKTIKQIAEALNL